MLAIVFSGRCNHFVVPPHGLLSHKGRGHHERSKWRVRGVTLRGPYYSGFPHFCVHSLFSLRHPILQGMRLWAPALGSVLHFPKHASYLFLHESRQSSPSAFAMPLKRKGNSIKNKYGVMVFISVLL